MVINYLRRQSHVVQEVRGVVGEAVEVALDLPTEFGEVVAPGVGVRDPLFEAAPELFDRIQPGCVGWQPQDFDAGLPTECLADTRMLMHGPVVPHDEDLLGRRVPMGELS